MTGQLPLDLPHRENLSEEDFLEAPFNAQAVAMIRLWPEWPQKMLLLTGPKGAGKSHLGAIWARRASARTFAARDLSLGLLPELADEKALLLEDADAAPAREAEMFHLLNMVGESGAYLMISARQPPNNWGLATPDLLSRLRRAPTVAIDAPDEAFLRSILVKLFHDRQIRVDETVIDFLALRLERSFEAAQAIVAALDREGLARGRPITRPLAATLLNSLPGHAAQMDWRDSRMTGFSAADDRSCGNRHKNFVKQAARLKTVARTTWPRKARPSPWTQQPGRFTTRTPHRRGAARLSQAFHQSRTLLAGVQPPRPAGGVERIASPAGAGALRFHFRQ